MKSCLYECRVVHARFAPQRHRFDYRIFLFAIDLDELPELGRTLRLFGHNSPNLYSFRSTDFLPTSEPVFRGSAADSSPSVRLDASPGGELKSRVVEFAARHQVDIRDGRIALLALPRVLGYLFNPVCFYFCHDRDGAPAAVIAEVTNTFRETKLFFLGPESLDTQRGQFRLRVPKHFYVSPFSDVDVAFDFVLRCPGARLALQIDDYAGSERTLTSTLIGERRPLTDARLAWFTIKYPLITLHIIARIHWQALRLWWKRVPWFAKNARVAEQRSVYRPHHSLRATDAA